MADQIWPNFYIVGAQKCGTTTLWAYLARHPQVFFPKMKEPIFFLSQGPPPGMTPRWDEWCVGDQPKYLELFRDGAGYPAIGDASPQYLWDRASAELIRRVSPDARILVILRDPVVRAHSQYLMRRTLGLEPCSRFLDALHADLEEMEDAHQNYFVQRNYIAMGLYYEQVRRYFDVFGRQNVLVLLLEELSTNPEMTMAKVTAHLGIEPLTSLNEANSMAANVYKSPKGALQTPFLFARRVLSPEIREKYFPEFLNHWLRNSPLLYSRKKPVIDLASRHLLQGIFAPDIVKLEALLERDLPELRKLWIANGESEPALRSQEGESVRA